MFSPNEVLYEKKYNILKKVLEMHEKVMYISYCCDMIAMKREVAAASTVGFSVERMSS